jgi:hypothetical protein
MRRQVIHVTAGFPRRPAMDMLEASSRDYGYRFIALPDRHAQPRLNTVDKVRLLDAFLKTGAVARHDIVMFTDAYDVLVVEHAALLHERFIAWNVDLVVNAEANLFPDDEGALRTLFDHHPSRWRYLNSGCFVGFAWAVREVVDFVSRSIPEVGFEAHHMDQLLMQQFYAWEAARRGVRMVLDTDTRLFAPLMMTEAEFETDAYGVRNRVTGQRPCVLHANGDRANMSILKVLSGMRGHVGRHLATACVEELPLTYDRDARRLSGHSHGEAFFILVDGDVGAPFRPDGSFFTFRPEGVVHTDASSRREWETVMIAGKRLATVHGPLEAFVEGHGVAEVQLAPLPLPLLKAADPEAVLTTVEHIIKGG